VLYNIKIIKGGDFMKNKIKLLTVISLVAAFIIGGSVVVNGGQDDDEPDIDSATTIVTEIEA